MSGFTKEIIARTFTELLDEKPMSKITVKDIVEHCGVNRNTFYYHFRDIPDAVEAMVKEELNDGMCGRDGCADQRKQEDHAECLPVSKAGYVSYLPE